MADLILHVGLHRTGSTSVQHALTASREKLRSIGVLYPHAGSIEVAHHGLSFALGEKTNSPWGPLPPLDQLLSELQTEINASRCHTVLISSEDFRALCYEKKPAVVERTRQFLALFSHVRIICFLRHQIPYLDSAYRINVAWSGHRLELDFRPWVQRDCVRPWYDCQQIERFYRQFSPDITVDFLSFAAAKQSGALVRYFYEQAGILDAYAGEVRVNESASRLSILAMLAANQRKLSLAVSRDQFDNWARLTFPENADSLFDEELLRFVDGRFRAENDTLAQRTGFNLNDEIGPFVATHRLAGASLTPAEQSMLRHLLARDEVAVPAPRFSSDLNF